MKGQTTVWRFSAMGSFERKVQAIINIFEDSNFTRKKMNIYTFILIFELRLVTCNKTGKSYLIKEAASWRSPPCANLGKGEHLLWRHVHPSNASGWDLHVFSLEALEPSDRTVNLQSLLTRDLQTENLRYYNEVPYSFGKHCANSSLNLCVLAIPAKRRGFGGNRRLENIRTSHQICIV